MDYTTLIGAKTVSGSIKNWLNNSLVPSDVVIAEAEQWIYRRLRVRQMLASTTGTLSTGTGSLALPSDYITARQFLITGTGYAELTPKTLEELRRAYTYDGAGARVNQKPTQFSVDADNIQFDSPPDAAYPYDLLYYRGLPALSTSTGSDTNFLTNKAPYLLRSAILMMANDFLKDDQEKVYWESKAEKEIERLNVENEIGMKNADMTVQVI